MSVVGAAAVGVLVGVVVGTLGAGGGILSLPILVYALGFAPHSAATASLVIVGASSLVSLYPHARRGNVAWGQGVAFGLLGAVGAIGGARLAALVDAELLMVLLTVLLLAVATLMLRRSLRGRRVDRREAPDDDAQAAAVGTEPVVTGGVDDDGAQEPAAAGGTERAAAGTPPPGRLSRAVLTVVVASATGLLTGFFGVGGGFVVVPALLLVMRVSMGVAVGTSLLVIVLNATTGLLGRVGDSFEIDWAVVAAFAVASMVGGLLGARFSSRARPQTLGLLFALLLACVAVATGVQAVPALLAG